VLVEDWLGKGYALEVWVKKGPPLVKEAALARLARRYVEAYGPAGPQDLAAWSGIPMRDARFAWELIAGDLIPVEIPGGPAYLLEERLTWLEEPMAQPDVRLLPKFDIYLPDTQPGIW
jgi:hypothetical protein